MNEFYCEQEQINPTIMNILLEGEHFEYQDGVFDESMFNFSIEEYN